MKRVMIVDDDKDFLEELTDVMDMCGYEVIPVSDSYDVISQVLDKHPDIIILDLLMNGFDGFELARRIKEVPETNSIKLIALTGYYTGAEDQVRMMKHGFSDCVFKPVHPLDVLSAIELQGMGERAK
ncbi:MAG: response regulator [Deltaproteobacteria bacterium]|jgi:CheY-like chemotaxis protein|nr:response regulator [Deltaproteobacteria bacterium]